MEEPFVGATVGGKACLLYSTLPCFLISLQMLFFKKLKYMMRRYFFANNAKNPKMSMLYYNIGILTLIYQK